VTDEVTLIADIYPGPNGGMIEELTPLDGKLYFRAEDDMTGKELWVYDPVSDQTSLVVDINANGNGSSTPNDLLAWNGKLYFEADEPVLGSELYQYDPATDDLQVIDIAPGSADSGPRDLAIFNDKVFFTAFDPDNGLTLRSYDPVTEELEAYLVDGVNKISAQFLTPYDDKLFFHSVNYPGVGRELWYYDPAQDTIVLVEDLIPGSTGSSPLYLTVFNDKLYFQATTDEFGTELWEYDAATETLQIYADIWGGGFSSDPSYLTVFNDKLYFAANNGDKGSEIWSLAACLNLFVTTNPQNGPDPNGSIDLTVEGGTPPYTFSWSSGASSEDVADLLSGSYTVTVTDDLGCIATLTATVDLINATQKQPQPARPLIFPNPNAGTFEVQFSQAVPNRPIQVFGTDGRPQAFRVLQQSSQQLTLQLVDPAPGLYFVEGVVVLVE
jgi:ELWxxDGT repeat protein